MSNFYPVKLKYTHKDEICTEGFTETYCSVEQGFQHIKAKHNKDDARATLIMKAKEPSLAKHYGDEVVVTKLWLDEVREGVLEKLDDLKYDTSKELSAQLCKTHPHPLVEGTKDLHWAGAVHTTTKTTTRGS